MKPVLWMATLGLLSAAPAYAQDAVTVDPKHYKVEMENDQVRVLRIHYGAGEKSVMHSHPASVAVRASGNCMDRSVAEWAMNLPQHRGTA